MGGYERQLRAVVARRDPRRLQRQAARGGLAALRGADGERDRPRAVARGDGGRPADQRARGVHAGRRVHPRAVRRARLLGRRRLLRARARRRGRHGASSSPSGSSRARRRSTSGTWTRAASAPPTARASTRSPARSRSTRRTTTSSTRGTSARPGGRCASRPPTRGSPELGAAFGEKSGWERANWFEPNAARGRRVAAAARLGGQALVAGDRRRAPRVPRGGRALRRDVVREDRGRRARARPTFLERLCANRVARDVGAITYTQMLNARGGIECDFTVTRLAEERFRIVTGTAFGQHDLAWIRQHAPDDGSVHVADVTSQLRLPRPLGPASREILAAADDDRPRERGVPVHARAGARGRPRAVPRRCASPTSASSAGSSTARPSSGSRLWDTLWEAGGEHGLVAGGYKAIDSLRLEKGYRVWGADITPEDTPYEAGLGFAVKLDKGDFVGRDALARAAASRSGGSRCLDARRPARGRARLGAGARRRASSSGRVTSGGYGYTVERSIAYAYLPARAPTSGTPVAVEIFGEWVDGRGRRPSRSTTRRESGSAPERRARRGRRARLAGRRARRWEVLGGGITNHNVKVTRPDGVVRAAHRRARTPSCSASTGRRSSRRPRAAAAVGVGPEVVDFVEPEGWLVTRFIEGAIPPLEQIREPDDAAARRARAPRRPRRPGDPGAVRRAPDRRGVRDDGDRRAAPTCPPRYAWAHELARRIERAAPRAPPSCGRATTTCSTRTSSTTARGSGSSTGSTPGMGDPFFDLGELRDQPRARRRRATRCCSTAYVGARARRSTRARSTLMRFMSDFREAMWGVVQQARVGARLRLRALRRRALRAACERTAAEPGVPARARRAETRRGARGRPSDATCAHDAASRTPSASSKSPAAPPPSARAPPRCPSAPGP